MSANRLSVTMVLTGGFLLITLVLGQVPVESNPIDLDTAAKYFAHAKSLSDADGSDLWGWPLYGPMIFVDPVSRFCIANQADAEGRLTSNDGVFSGTLPNDAMIANTATRWAGVKWTMVLWPLPENKYRRGRLLAHELFHRMQDDIGLPMKSPDNGHLDSRDGRIWLRLEWRALSEALIQRDIARLEAVEDALVFRYYRWLLLPNGADNERALELNEGLAEYTGFALSGLPAHVLPDRAAIQLEEYEHRDSFVRNFAYASGPAYGILLDEVGIQWRDQMTPEEDLGAKLRAAYTAEVPTDLRTEAHRRAAKYDGRSVIAQETLRDVTRKARQAEFRERFVNGATLTVPRVENIRYSFNPNAVEAFDNVGSVYLTTRVTDAWGILEVTAGGALMIRGGGLVDRFIVPAPLDVTARPVVGDGWTLELAEGWTLNASQRKGDWIIGRIDE
ncbi:MAG: hypothetical protein V3T53_09020 [Phycisphaerales bacterium]